MLLEITPEEVHLVTPIIPTREQYLRYWEDGLKNSRRIVIAVGVGVLFLFLSRLAGDESFLGFLFFLAGVLTLPYPFLWGPVYAIAKRNLSFREIPYAGLFFGQVSKTRSLTVLIEEREKVDENGDLYIEEVRERQFEMEVADEEGVSYRVRAKDDPRFRSIVQHQSVIAMVKAYSRDLQRRPVISEVYVVKLGEWVGDVSYLKREGFLELANDLLEAESPGA
jgi:hypothetical protein